MGRILLALWAALACTTVSGFSLCAETPGIPDIDLCPFYCQAYNQEPLFGYLDSRGNAVLHPEFVSASRFSANGLAVAQDRNGRQCIINATGEVVARLDYKRLLPFGDDGLAAVCDQDGKWGYVDSQGVLTVPCEYDGAERFSKGLAIVQKKGKYGAINALGKTVIPFEYLHLSGFSKDCDVAVAEKGWRSGLIDRNGDVVVEAEYDVIAMPGVQGEDSLLAVKRDGLWGYIGFDGKERIPPQFAYAGEFRAGLAPVSAHGRLKGDRVVGDYVGFIDKTASWIVDPKYEMAGSFTPKGLAPVMVEGRYGIINRSGALVADPVFSYTSLEPSLSGLIWVRHEGRYYWVDSDGERYDEYDVLQNGLTLKIKDGDGGYVNSEGETVLHVNWSYSLKQRKISVWNDAGTVMYP